ncbi:MAG TPA: BadF/BadG/BcrA/BcrD ATPase family protein [Vicinamibacterales bacterium]|nr:BadF/BadG/BcrA/BcrD ATPase family protein [Vicinamibacterales bacterium]
MAPRSGGPVRHLIGLDVGSTTVKAVVVERDTDRIVWQDYQRHEARQPEKVREFLGRIENDLGVRAGSARVFITGSGGGSLADAIGAKFVQEVTAVSLAVEKLHPEVRSVIELGGQDAKIIVFREDAEGGRKKKIPSMNDKCAGGTGAVIDKIAAKLRIPPEDVGQLGYQGIKLHKVAGKCGVFAETDINGLQKLGTPVDQLMASLFDALVLQNLTVLTRGHTLLPHVLLLGGPNAFIRGLREAWRANIPRTWEERGVDVPPGACVDELISVPDHALYFAALGAVEFGKDQDEFVGAYGGTSDLSRYLDSGRRQERARTGAPGLVASAEELEAFRREFVPTPFVPAAFTPGETVRAFVGVDGGSTSTKAVLLSPEGEVLAKAYKLSEGNPIGDTQAMFEALRSQVEGRGARLDVLGVATTGYAKDMLFDVLQADVALVETVAHTTAAVRDYHDPHVIVDVGGQDIKLIVLKDGRVKDFKLNTQCSAGNGYFLQSTAEGLGIPVDRYADIALQAEVMPVFGYGCAVFLQSDIVNFQRQGWRADEILAGLAAVLPKNVFLYVARCASLPSLGSRFVLQGGTQHNLAVVKAEVDFIRASFRAAGREPQIVVHRHCGEAGAIGAAVEALRLWQAGRQTTFIGLEAVRRITYTTTRDERTRCSFCKNHCLRTFIDIQIGAPDPGAAPADRRVPLAVGARRLIIATCEKGAVEQVDEMRNIKSSLEAAKLANPNLVELAAHEAFRLREVAAVAEGPPRGWTTAARVRAGLMARRRELRVGMPRVLNTYIYAPLYNAYLQSLGVQAEHIVYSDYTSDELYRTGSSRGAIDPCFPSKIAIAHVHNLMTEKARRRPLDVIFFPMVDVLHSRLKHLQATDACPTVTACPNTVKAAFTKERDVFSDQGIRFLDPMLNFANPRLLTDQMFRAWRPVLGLSEAENERAVDAGVRALDEYETGIRGRAREVLDALEREDRIGLVMLGRPYHHDPGVNHGILEEFQKRGYPVFSQSTLPLDPDLLERLFGAEVRAGVIRDPLDLDDVWKNTFSASTNHKLWAAKFAARHPNLVALEVSSFKCGHDAPIYGVIEAIIEQSGTPYFSFKDLDENTPTGAIRIRVETIDYFLRRYREVVAERRRTGDRIEAELGDYERRLRAEASAPS